jgi:HSP20 family protein
MDSSFGHFLEVARIQSEVNKLFDVLLQTRGAEGDGAQRWLPNVDILETDCEVVLRCEVPGVPREALRLTAQGGALVIAGEKAQSRPAAKARFHCVERAYGSFQRVVHLPPMINTRSARAKLHNGVLTILFPKVSNRRGEEVVIPVEEEETVGAR